MKPNVFVTSLGWVLLFLLPTRGWGETEIRKVATDHFEVILNGHSCGPIRVLQVTDLHLGKMDFWKPDLATFKRIRRLVETQNPDLIVVTGGLRTGEKYFGSLLAAFARLEIELISFARLPEQNLDVVG